MLDADEYENEIVLEGDVPVAVERDEKKYHRHSFRWLMMILFIFCGISNTWIQLSFSPIIWQSKKYFGSAFDGEDGQWTVTAINALSALFPLLYIPGSYKAAKVLKRNQIRAAIVQGMSYTALGTCLRFFTANSYSQRDPIDTAFENSTVNYALIFVGTWMCALAQPIFLNTPTMVALVWFSVSERELAMTAMTLTQALGSALGSTVPTTLVTWEPWNNHQEIREQVQWLMMVQFVAAMLAMVTAYNLFANQPPTPPTRAAERLRQEVEEERQKQRSEGGPDVKEDTDDPGRLLIMRANMARGLDAYEGLRGDDVPDSPPPMEGRDAMRRADEAAGGGGTRKKKKKYKSYGSRVRESISLLMRNPQFLKLLLGFAMAQGTLVSLASLVGQLPAYESPAVLGLCWFVLTIFGSLSTILVGVLMGKNKKYSGVLKLSYLGAVAAWGWLMTNIRSHNQTWLLASSAVAGVFLIPIIPSTYANAIEVTYPVPEVVTVGVLCSAGNTLSVVFIFVGQYLLFSDAQTRVGMDNSVVRYSPYALFSTVCLAVGLLAVLMYHSEGGRRFGRLYMDVPRSERDAEEIEEGGGAVREAAVATAVLSSP